VNVRRKISFCRRVPESGPSAKVTVCGTESLLVQQTVVPGVTVVGDGSYLKLVMLIIVSPAGQGPGAAVPPTVTTKPAVMAPRTDSTASAFIVDHYGQMPLPDWGRNVRVGA
jgi:hypothetical protein